MTEQPQIPRCAECGKEECAAVHQIQDGHEFVRSLPEEVQRGEKALTFEIRVPIPQERPVAGSGGQAAYEAYCDSLGWRSAVSGDPLPSWVDQAANIRQGWMDAAGAAIKWYLDSATDEGT